MLDELCVLGLTGAQLLASLENGVSQYPKLEGRWPCVSGVSFTFDPKKPACNGGGSNVKLAPDMQTHHPAGVRWARRLAWLRCRLSSCP